MLDERVSVWPALHDDGRREIVEWYEGDLITPPFNAWRSHHAAAGSAVRLLMSRNTIFERALGLKMGIPAPIETLPVRFPERVEVGA